MATTLSDEFTDITKLLDQIEDRIDFVVDREELGDALLDAAELGHRAQALVARLGLAALNNGVAARVGQRTAGQFVAARTNTQGVEIDRLVNNAKWLRDFPLFDAAYGTGLTNAHVDYLRKKLDTFDTNARLKQDQQILVDAGTDCTFKGFVEACEYWLVRIDPDGKEPQDQIDKSSFRVGNGRGGRGDLKGTCDAVTAQAIKTAVDHEAEKLRRQDKIDGLLRTDSQRKMAALHALVVRGFARDDGTYPAPLANIVMSLAVAEWALAALTGNIDPEDAQVVPVDPNDVDGRCELIDGTPIHPFLAVAALGLISPQGSVDPTVLRRYVMEADSRLLDVSVNARIFPEWMRTAAFVQSRGACETHGCEAPHSWMQADHTHPVAHGGQTRFNQAQTQCWPDNHAKGATPGLTAWRDRPPPPRRTHRSRSNTNGDGDGDSDGDGDDSDNTTN